MQTSVENPRPRRRRRLRLVAIVAALAALASACGSDTEDPAAAPEVAVGPVLDASILTGEATTVTGETVDLASFADQDLVVWFWAPW